jgi:hypothetical protein
MSQAEQSRSQFTVYQKYGEQSRSQFSFPQMELGVAVRRCKTQIEEAQRFIMIKRHL